jgi:replication factor C subunit 3/5
MSKIPWVECYRPTNFEEIVLDNYNKILLEQIINQECFPNLLLFGPPGTGKTTTIINLINKFQEKLNMKNKDLVIHLNASDERGIDIIRNQINNFVNSKPLFNKGLKFVILDEVDYMTKNAQQALKYLLQKYNKNVRFCLICNYISKIDTGVQNEFCSLRFNQLPEKDIIGFLKKIVKNENLRIDDSLLSSIQKMYKSDIRSMINYLQSNQDILNQKSIISLKIINIEVWKDLLNDIKNNDKIEIIYNKIENISINFNIQKKKIIIDFINYLIQTEETLINSEFLSFTENLIHASNIDDNIYVKYFLSTLQSFLHSSSNV